MKISEHIWPLMAVMALWSCTDRSFSGLSEKDLADAEGEPELVTVLVGDYAHPDLTKGAGVVTDRYTWADSLPQIGVYAFLKDSSCMSSRASDSDGRCLIDGTIDGGSAVKGGRTSILSQPEYVLKWLSAPENAFTRYPKGKVPYDFYAYYTGGAAVRDEDISRTDDCISFPVRIDGAMDLMYARTAQPSSYLSDLSAEETDAMSVWCYSDYAAKRGILPVLLFNHALTRISFDLYPGEKGCDQTVIQRIDVMTRDSCIFTVASRDTLRPVGADFSMDTKDAILQLTEPDGSPLDTLSYHTTYYGDFTEDILSRPHVRVGGSFLLPSEESYKFVLYYWLKEYDARVRSSIVISPVKGGPFLTGSSYVVRLEMLHFQAVDFDVDVDPWDDGGDGDISYQADKQE